MSPASAGQNLPDVISFWVWDGNSIKKITIFGERRATFESGVKEKLSNFTQGNSQMRYFFFPPFFAFAFAFLTIFVSSTKSCIGNHT